MGIFDLFGKEPRTKNARTISSELQERTELAKKTSSPLSVFSPTSFNDVEKIIDAFREGKATVVHLNELKQETALRVLDMLSGAIYALGGGVYEMEKNVFMFSASGVEMN